MADYEVSFKAPALPYPPKEYNAEEFNQFNNVIRLYFNHIDNTLRDTQPILNKDNLIHDLVLMFEDDNHLFDGSRFKEACE